MRRKSNGCDADKRSMPVPSMPTEISRNAIKQWRPKPCGSDAASATASGLVIALEDGHPALGMVFIAFSYIHRGGGVNLASI